MTDQETDDLRAFSAEIANVETSPWEPRCVARAFATPGPEAIVFTMQHWIDLDALRSPLLNGELPEDVTTLDTSTAVFGLKVSALSPVAAMAVVDTLRAVIREAWAMALRMEPPRVEGATQTPSADDGFGGWLPLLSFLILKCHAPLAEARAFEVRHAFALLAAARREDGWEVGGETYALRDLDNAEGTAP